MTSDTSVLNANTLLTFQRFSACVCISLERYLWKLLGHAKRHETERIKKEPSFERCYQTYQSQSPESGAPVQQDPASVPMGVASNRFVAPHMFGLFRTIEDRKIEEILSFSCFVAFSS